jgi:hypothetical protein
MLFIYHQDKQLHRNNLIDTIYNNLSRISLFFETIEGLVLSSSRINHNPFFLFLSILSQHIFTNASKSSIILENIPLSFILNLLDGVLETPNRILIITSNYPKRLDKALVRPGRIDINIEFTNASLKMIESMLCHFYNKTQQEIKMINIY